ncbi:MAG: tryptophan-rich sensory protein [Ruminiclostridium sp.]|nr:tryptophan-rich sensory protein [Ruminiclostridium sp.]
MNKKLNITDLLIFILSAELGGALSAIAAGGDLGGYYATLTKPPLSPPGWLFPVVWGVLYAVMGISAYLISESGDIHKNSALTLYIVQLFANLLWSPVFFGLRSSGGAAAVVIVMLILVICMTAVFGRINRCAALMNIPYILWTAYAAYLTAGVFVLNG